jgi:ABC-type polysaccharide/polyol phosphate transport system ATPase subunit
MAEAEPRPSVIVSHVDVVYRVFAGSGPGGGRRPGRRVRQVHAVKDVSFVAHHGESIGVIGRNGSGKSTLLRTVAGLVPPTAGEVWADGTPSLLGVNAVLVRQLSGARNIYIGAQALGLSRAQVDDVYDEIVEFSGIGDAIHLPMSTYSSGMAARLRFAISTAAVPPVLVIDEALATGDRHFRTRSQERIERLRDQAGTVFLVSHSAATIRSMCDRALWLEQGELVMDGPVDDVVDAYSEAAEKSLGSSSAAEPEVPGVERWSGESRVHTSALASRQGTPGRRDTVLLAAGNPLPLAISAIPAATKVGAPLLLTSPGELMSVTRKELTRLEARRVFLLGGPEVVAPEVEAATRDARIAVERIPGEDAVAASLALHADLDAGDGIEAVYLVPSLDREAALVAAITARAGDGRVLLLGEDGPRPAHDEVLERIRPRRVVVVADDETIGDDVVEALGRHAAEGAQRLLMPTSAQAAAEAAEAFGPEQVGVVYIAPGGRTTVRDAAVGLAVASLAGAPLLLVERDEVPPVTHTELERLAPSHLVVVGGEMSVSSSVRQVLSGYLRPADRGSDDEDIDL